MKIDKLTQMAHWKLRVIIEPIQLKKITKYGRKFIN